MQFVDYIIGVGKVEFDICSIGILFGICDIYWVSDVYKFVFKKWKVEDIVIDFGDGIQLGIGYFGIMVGFCLIELEEQIEKIIMYLQQEGVCIMWGGVYKLCSLFYFFWGFGIDGLKMWYKCICEAGIKIIIEVMMVE